MAVYNEAVLYIHNLKYFKKFTFVIYIGYSSTINCN
jgi:hypothetical protein